MEELIVQYGYLIIFLYSLGGGFIALLIAGVLSHLGELDIYISIMVALVSNFLGDSILFYVSKRNKGLFINQLKNSKRKIAYSKVMIKKYGVGIIFLQKYLYGFKTFVPIAMAITNFKFKKFLFYNLFASILWAIIVGYLSYINGEFIKNIYYKYSNPTYSIAIFIGIVIVLNYLMGLAIKRRNKV